RCHLPLHAPVRLPVSSHHVDLHSFPTRRSSDLSENAVEQFMRDHLRRQGAIAAGPAKIALNALAERLLAHADLQRAEARFAAYLDRKSTRLNSSHGSISYAVFCLKKKTNKDTNH